MRPLPLLALAMFVLVTSLDGQTPGGFTPLFTGTLAGWTVEHTDAGNIRVEDGLLRVEGPGGWLRSAARYRDFDLRVEFRFVTVDADSGVFIRADGTTTFGRGWPNRSYQVQLRNPLGQSRFPPVGHLYRHGMPSGDLSYDPADASRLSIGTGDWQVLEISAVGERVSATLNGEVLMRASGVAVEPGHLGLQAETGALEFRAIAIRER